MGASGAGVSWLGNPLLFYGGILFGIVISAGLMILLILLWRSKNKAEEILKYRFKDKKIVCLDRRANYFGTESKKRNSSEETEFLYYPKRSCIF